ncbi:MAG TPA: DNA primase [Candidatus Lumbricidophila sp.]|nr:DNA primase [Candidatus Lumbricidophila sp.]
MAGRIRQSDVEEVKARTRIEEIVGEHVALKSAGVGSMKGLCPFHDERSPSFHVRPQVGYYHCFGCGESGDVYSFLQKMEHVTFSEAVERLAGKIGYELHYEDGGEAQTVGNRARLLAANQAAAEYFQAQLAEPGAGVGRSFLGERGFDASAAAHFSVGFAPKSWDELTKHLNAKGFTDEELLTAGLVSQRDRGVYDRFRGRLVWPIRDVTGQTVGFGARRLLDDDQGPKYLNTPETPLYRKAHVLYGLDLAKREISKSHRVVVVEGYTDVMACHLAGETTAIATCGTAFGVDHIKLLRRVLGDDSGVGEVVFTFDGDAAGQNAALKAFAEEQRFAANTFVAVAPDGLDPCDLRLKRGDGAVRNLIASRTPMFEFVIRSTVQKYDLNTVEGRIAAVRAAAPIVANLRDPALRPGYQRELARMLGLELDEVARAVRAASPRAVAQSGERDRAAAGNQPPSPSTRRPTQPDAQAALPERPFGLADLPNDPSTRLERDAIQALLQAAAWAEQSRRERALTARMQHPALAVIRDALQVAGATATLDAVLAELPTQFQPLAAQLAVAPMPYSNQAELGTYVNGVLAALLERELLRQKSELLGQLQRAGATATPDVAALQRALVDVESARRALRAE